MSSEVIVGIGSLVVALALGLPALFVGLKALRVAEKQTALAEQEVQLAERATQPRLWVRPATTDEDEGTGNPMGADLGADGFGFTGIVGNDGGGTALGVFVVMYIGEASVHRAHVRSPNIPQGGESEFRGRVPAEYVISFVAPEVPNFAQPLRLCALTADGRHEGWWRDAPEER